MPKAEVPPEYLWEDSEGLEMWWKSVEDKRDDGQGVTERPHGGDDDQDPGPGMAENDLARTLKQ